MIRLDNISIEETVEQAHAAALAAAEINVGLDICFTENELRRHYTIDFIRSFLDAAIDEDVPDGSDGWTLEQTKSHLISSGFILVPFPIKTTVFSTFDKNPSTYSTFVK